MRTFAKEERKRIKQSSLYIIDKDVSFLIQDLKKMMHTNQMKIIIIGM